MPRLCHLCGRNRRDCEAVQGMAVCPECRMDLEDGHRPGTYGQRRVRGANSRPKTAQPTRVAGRTATKTTIDGELSPKSGGPREDDNRAGAIGGGPGCGLPLEPPIARARRSAPITPLAETKIVHGPKVADTPATERYRNAMKATIGDAVLDQSQSAQLELTRQFAPEVESLHVTVSAQNSRRYHVTAFVPAGAVADDNSIAGRLAAGLARLAPAIDFIPKVVRRRSNLVEHVDDNPDGAVEVEMLDFPNIGRLVIGLGQGVRVLPIRAVWDILTVPCYSLGSSPNIPDSVKNDARVFRIVVQNEATIRRLRRRFRQAMPNAATQPSQRFGRIIGIDHLTEHATVEHTGGIVVHWPTRCLMTIGEDFELPVDVLAPEPADEDRTFDPDDFRSRRKARRG